VSPEPVSAGPRVRELRAASRRALLWRLGQAVAVAVAVAAAGWLAFLSPVLALDPDRIAVVSEGELDLAAAQDVIADVSGVPLPRIGIRSLEKRLEEIPTVHTATVSRRWPDGLSVELVARQPVAAVPGDAGFVVFDREGVELGTSPAPPPGIPVVNVPLGENTARILAAALHVIAGLPEDLRATVTGVSAQSDASITFTLSGGATVRWGTDTDNELKLAVLQTLRQVPARIYDVSTPRAPLTE